MILEICFWALVAFVLYTYVGYPVLLAFAGRLRNRPVRTGDDKTLSVSVVLAVYNEEHGLARRLEELTNLLAATGVVGEVIVVSDGSTDGTAAVARSFTRGTVRLIELPTNAGKAAALTAGCRAARNEILVFADARQTWAPDSLGQLLRPFADPTVGAVSGDLTIESAPGALAGVGLYWRYEKWIRRQESRIHSSVGVTGAICAVRRHLFRPIPTGTLLDDVFWPLQVALQSHRVVHESGARAFDRFPTQVRSEFRRKVRTLTGNFQLLVLLPSALLPWRNPVWFQFLSHKVFRLLVPWALLGLLGLSLALTGPVYEIALGTQVLCYTLAAAGLNQAVARRFRLASAAASFLVLNAAAWVAFWNWALGRATRSWVKVTYQPRNPAYGPILSGAAIPLGEPVKGPRDRRHAHQPRVGTGEPER
jgi:cellulose synthase/poly-beta-1,6-N-acetylglucosamine synthase-like glycosyltransferase